MLKVKSFRIRSGMSTEEIIDTLDKVKEFLLTQESIKKINTNPGEIEIHYEI